MILPMHDLPPFKFWVYSASILDFLHMFRLRVSIETGLYVAWAHGFVQWSRKRQIWWGLKTVGLSWPPKGIRKACEMERNS